MEYKRLMDNFYKELFIYISSNILINEPMKSHTYFKIGGPADLFVEPQSIDELKIILNLINKYNINYFVIGNGTNLLVSDEGFRGIIIKIGEKFNYINKEGNTVTVGSGTLLSVLSKYLARESLEGFEFASGIPGLLGGAVSMNAGAYGGEMKDVIKSVKCIDKNGNLFNFTNEEMDFSYRHSRVSDSQLIVLEAAISLNPGNKDHIFEKIKELNEMRTSKQPLNLPSAGSTFKRPLNGYASKLIEEAGLKGLTYKGAMVSDKHCGFIVNIDNASCDDVLELMRIVISTVYDKFNIKLEPEIKIIGTEL
ncbi:MAG: UDP-N-acetylmuramate dehydrogenase [Tissierellia bacterium]|nr:UDP-N-acetylmuramate dehydrogenase [Tissierellia bacterium]